MYCNWRGEHQDQERAVCLRDSYCSHCDLPHHHHCQLILALVVLLLVVGVHPGPVEVIWT